MSDRAIEAIHRMLVATHGDAAANDLWAAGVEVVIAHALCGGTNHRIGTAGGPNHECDTWCECPGPHTIIDKGDGTKLYADRTKLYGLLMMLSGLADVGAYHLTADDPRRMWLPSKWRIE